MSDFDAALDEIGGGSAARERIEKVRFYFFARPSVFLSSSRQQLLNIPSKVLFISATLSQS